MADSWVVILAPVKVELKVAAEVVLKADGSEIRAAVKLDKMLVGAKGFD